LRLDLGEILVGGEVPQQVEALVLIGSHARGDFDETSDCDVVAFVNAASGPALTAASLALESRRTLPNVSFTIYSVDAAQVLARQRSLFLWHLKLEGKVLLARSAWLRALLEDLGPYSRQQAEVDLAMMHTLLFDVIESLDSETRTLLFEGATLFTVLRIVGMVLSAATATLVSGRRAAVNWLAQTMGDSFPLTAGEVEALETARLLYSGKMPRAGRADPDRAWLQDVAGRCRAILEFASWRISLQP
jgi:hypothetical protein